MDEGLNGFLWKLPRLGPHGYCLEWVSMDVVRLGSNGCGQTGSLWMWSDWLYMDVVALDPFGCLQTGSLWMLTHSVPMDVVRMGIYLC